MKKQCKLFLMLLMAIALVIPACRTRTSDPEPPPAVCDPNAVIDINAIADTSSMLDNSAGDYASATFDGKYRDDLAKHPGCVKRGTGGYTNNLYLTKASTTNEAVVPGGDEANIAGYNCAAKEYAVDEDTKKPIVILVHGNSETVNAWEEWYSSNSADGKGGAGTKTQTLSKFSFTVETAMRQQLASKLVAEGFRTIAVDFRTDLVSTLKDGTGQYANPTGNIDHGWSVPILQSLIKAVMTENPKRKVVLIGHSLGVTTIRDALRRNFISWLKGEDGAVNPFPQIKHIIGLHGANHGVSTYEANCGTFKSMRGTVTCQMGSRNAYQVTDFHKPLNTIDEAPCQDGQTAFCGGVYGDYTSKDICKENVIKYTTVTLKDNLLDGGQLQDEFVSEASAKLNADYAENLTIEPTNYDASGYFFGGLFANHYASPRSDAGMQIVMDKLAE